MSGPALYVHIPFCEAKCPYCDFTSYALEGRDVDAYIDTLRDEMDARGVPEDPPTLYVGGGTPTVVQAKQLRRYLTDLVARLRPDAEREFTIEANPGSLDAEKVAVLREVGVNRVSIGAQALEDRHLVTLGRVHRVADVERALHLVREAGIGEVSLDLMCAIPGQTLAEWVATLQRAVAWGLPHLSCYALTFEPGTEFHARRAAGRIRPVPEEAELSMFRITARLLGSAGLVRYEISNYARNGHACRHNLTYWRNEPYVGFGAGAHSYVGGRREANERHLARYAALVRERGSAVVSSECLRGAAGAREMIALGLRTAEGVDLDAIGTRFGVDARGQFAAEIDLLERGRFVHRAPRLRLARRGWRVADEVMGAFL